MTPYVLVTEFFPPRFGGIERTLEDLAQHLGLELTVLAPGPAIPGTPYQRITRSIFSGAGWPKWWWLVPWFGRAKRQGLRYIIFGHYSRAVMAGWIHRAGLPYGLLVHGNDVMGETRTWWQYWFLRRHLRGAQWIAVNSTWLADFVHGCGVPRAKIILGHPMLRSEAFLTSRRAEHTTTRLLTVCRLVARKNVAGVLTALKSVRGDWRYDVVGDGPERSALEQQVAALGLRERVVFHGLVDEARKRELLSTADIGIMVPTVRDDGKDIEGLGLFFAEASAAGLPVIGSRSGGVPDVVHDGQTGILVDPQHADQLPTAIQQLIDHPELRQAYGTAGRTFIEQEYQATMRLARFDSAIGRLIARSPSVSIIIPCYNSAETIAGTLASVEAQSFQVKEIILVDDGSTDDLESAIAPWRDRLTLIRQANGGAPRSRNAGAAKATGDYLLFLDADIRLVPDAVATMVRTLLAHPEADYAYSDYRFGWKHFSAGEYDLARLQQRNTIHTSSLIRRSAFPGFDPELRRLQDWDLWLTIAERGGRGIWIPRTLFTVQARQGGMSAWRPRIWYRLPFLGQGVGDDSLRRFREAERIVKAKHHLA